MKCVKCKKDISDEYILDKKAQYSWTIQWSWSSSGTSTSTIAPVFTVVSGPVGVELPTNEEPFPIVIRLCKECLLKILGDIIVTEAL